VEQYRFSKASEVVGVLSVPRHRIWCRVFDWKYPQQENLMKKLYTESDITNWQEVSQEGLGFHEHKLQNVGSIENPSHVLGMLSLDYRSIGFTEVALGNYARAKEFFEKSVRTAMMEYELFEKGSPLIRAKDFSLGDFQVILLAYSAGNSQLAREYAEHYKLEYIALTDGPKDSVYIMLALKALAEHRLDDARKHLATPPPKSIDKQFAGYVECLAAIANNNEEEFRIALQNATQGWQKFMSRVFKGHPQCVAFIGGVGFINLARDINGWDIDPEDERIPLGMLTERIQAGCIGMPEMTRNCMN